MQRQDATASSIWEEGPAYNDEHSDWKGKGQFRLAYIYPFILDTSSNNHSIPYDSGMYGRNCLYISRVQIRGLEKAP